VKKSQNVDKLVEYAAHVHAALNAFVAIKKF
jgi:hypothetical protein